jgi:hypothetical protein
MAKKRKKMRPTRRRRVGAAGGGLIMDVLGITAGAIVARKVDSFLPNLNPTIRNAAKVAVGVALPKFVKNPMIKAVGDGMIAVGGAGLVGGLVPALGATDEVLVISGADEINEVNGIDEIGQADINEVNGIDELSEEM